MKGAFGSCFGLSEGVHGATSTISTLMCFCYDQDSFSQRPLCMSGMLCVLQRLQDTMIGACLNTTACLGISGIARVQVLLTNVSLPTAGRTVRAISALYGTGLRAWALASAGRILQHGELLTGHLPSRASSIAWRYHIRPSSGACAAICALSK